MADDGKDDEFPDDPDYQWGDGLDDGPDVDPSTPLPISEMPEIPEEEKPTEEEIGDWDDADGEVADDDAEDTAARSFSSRTVNLPGAKGPLEVDSIGDYLDDFDFSGLDEIARQRAEQGYEMLRAAQEAEQKEEDRIQGIRQWHADNKRGKDPNLPRNPERPNRPPDWLIAGEDPPEEPPPVGEIPPDPDNQPFKLEPLKPGDDPEKVRFLQRRKVPQRVRPEKQGEGMFRIPPEEDLPEPYVKFSNQPLDDQGLEDQQRFQLDIPPESSHSDQGLQGQNESATEQVIEQATDAIKTNNARILALIQDMAQVLKGHETQINQIRDMLDMEGGADEY